jgi:uncharacterized iron-regulated protein
MNSSLPQPQNLRTDTANRSVATRSRSSPLKACSWLLAGLLMVPSHADTGHNWQSTLHHDHPLTGLIINTDTGTETSLVELLAKLQRADIVLLGEKHDNPDHHNLRHGLLQHLIDASAVASLSMEMLTTAQLPGIQNANRAGMLSDEDLRQTLDWDAGWNWEFYRAPLQSALAAGVSLRAANIDRATIGRIYAGESEPPRLANDQMARLFEEIDRSHCGLLPESQFAAMVRVQQARDMEMAAALTRTIDTELDRSGPHILMAGNFHVRHDLGVSNYLGDRELTVYSIAFLEVSPGSANFADYLNQFSDRKVFDYIWFTPAIEVPDYCATMRAGRQ